MAFQVRNARGGNSELNRRTSAFSVLIITARQDNVSFAVIMYGSSPPPPRHFSHTVGTLFSPESDSIREGVCIILLCLALADRWHCHHTESIWKTHFFFTHHMLQALGIMQKMTFSHLIIYVGRSIGAKTSSSTSILHVSPWKINLLIKDLP